MEEKPRSEKRKFKRVEVSFIVSYNVDAPLSVRMSVGKREFDAVALDLSEGGMAILTKYTDFYAIPIFTMLIVKFTIIDNAAVKIQDRYKPIEIKGEVRSSLFMKEQKAYRLGISFINVSNEQRKFIVEFINLSSLGRDKK
jgi:c-di-GMP-binding flagellar brake protein YcgR